MKVAADQPEFVMQFRIRVDSRGPFLKNLQSDWGDKTDTPE